LHPVLAPRFIFFSRSVSLYTVIERVKSRFREGRTKRDENVANCIKSRIVWLSNPVIDVQIFISKTYERCSN